MRFRTDMLFNGKHCGAKIQRALMRIYALPSSDEKTRDA